MCKTKQMAVKILLNSGYGALASVYFRFNSVRMAEAITATGQFVIKFVGKHINAYLNNLCKTNNVDYVVAGDTDSLYIGIQHIMKKFATGDTQKDVDIANTICNKIAKNVIKPKFEQLAKDLNCQRQMMFMDREAIASSAFWTAKKRYAMHVWDMEGVRYNEAHLKVVGLDLVKSTIPEWGRKVMRDSLHVLLDDTNGDNRMKTWLTSTKNEFKQLAPHDIAFNVKAGDFNKYKSETAPYFKGGAQIQIKSILHHNRLSNDLDLKDIPPIRAGESIKYSWLKLPNPYNIEGIAFDTFLDERFALNDYIDYNKQFDKTVGSKVKDMCDAIGLDCSDDVNVQSSFFSKG